MTDVIEQRTYQVRLGFGERAIRALAPAEVFVIVDSIPADQNAELLAEKVSRSSSDAIVLLATLRNASATAETILKQQVLTGGRVSINLILVGDDGGFAVEDYLAAGAIADALTGFGIDHSAPDVALAAEGFRALTKAVKHLVKASSSGLRLQAAGKHSELNYWASLDVETEAKVLIV